MTARTVPPLARTCRAGDSSAPLMASTSRATRPRAGTTVLPVGEGTMPLRPSTCMSTVTSLAPGLVRTTRSWRPGAPAPASSQRSEPGPAQDTVARPLISSRLTLHSCVAARPGARAPVATMSLLEELRESVEVVTPRVVAVDPATLPERMLTCPLPLVRTDEPRTDCGAVAAATAAGTSMSSTPLMPLSSGPGQDNEAVATGSSVVARAGCACDPASSVAGDRAAAVTSPAAARPVTTRRVGPTQRARFIGASSTRASRRARRGRRRRPDRGPAAPSTRGARSGRRWSGPGCLRAGRRSA